jgi:hypothetical protein
MATRKVMPVLPPTTTEYMRRIASHHVLLLRLLVWVWKRKRKRKGEEGGEGEVCITRFFT